MKKKPTCPTGSRELDKLQTIIQKRNEKILREAIKRGFKCLRN